MADKTERYLKRCNRIYEKLVAHVARLREKNDDAEAILTWVQLTASFCWVHPTGRYADGLLENVAFEIGGRLEALEAARARGNSSSANSSSGKTAPANSSAESSALPPLPAHPARRKVLHVATSVYPYGGHTRLLGNWIENDPQTCHSLLVVNQGSISIPQWLRAIVEASGGVLIEMPADWTLLERASQLRRLVQSNTDMIVLHHHPNDVVPTVALAVKECPPVAVLNHADHGFWLGSSVTDLVIEIRGEGEALSRDRRFVDRSLLLPMPISARPVPLPRAAARQRLGIPADQVMLLSIGSSYKYKPTEKHNFFRTTIRILEQNPAAHLYLIGVKWDAKVDYLQQAVHERLHLLGVLEDPTAYYAASDIYLNGFPYGSGMALLEAISYGNCPVFKFSPETHLLTLNDIALNGIVKHQHTEEEYVAWVEYLIRNRTARERLGRESCERLIEYHRGAKWHEHLEAIYAQIATASHRPAEIPNADFIVTENERAFARLSGIHMGKSHLLLSLGRQIPRQFRLKDMYSLLSMSFKMGAFRISPDDLKALLRSWRGMRLPRPTRS